MTYVFVVHVLLLCCQVPRDLAKVAIESGYYHLKAANLTAQVRQPLQAAAVTLHTRGHMLLPPEVQLAAATRHADFHQPVMT